MHGIPLAVTMDMSLMQGISLAVTMDMSLMRRQNTGDEHGSPGGQPEELCRLRRVQRCVRAVK
jgi:hypothetical protein